MNEENTKVELTEEEKEAQRLFEEEQKKYQEEVKMIDELSEEIFNLVLSREIEFYDGKKAIEQAGIRLTNKLNDIISEVKITNKNVKFVVEE